MEKMEKCSTDWADIWILGAEFAAEVFQIYIRSSLG